jgi:integral membrane protein
MQNRSAQKIEKRLIQVGHLEGVSYLLLLGVAMPLKYLFHWPPAVTYIGGIHGVLFVVFSLLILFMLIKKQLTFSQAVWSLLLSFLPFGTFFLEKSVLRR